jgi:tetratricopeptide (TPR) repeat protein
MLRTLPFILIAFFLLQPMQGRADDLSFKSAFDKQNKGLFFESLQAASQIKTADGYALSAGTRLILVRFVMTEEERLQNIDIALADALNALKIDPRHLQGNLQAAVGFGLKARIIDAIENARKAKFYIDQALEFHPQSPWAWAANGGWHAEVVQKAGVLLGAVMFSAKRKISISSFQKAIQLSENPIPFYLAYSQTLLRTHKKEDRVQAYSLLRKTVLLAPQNQLNKIAQQLAKQLLLALDKQDEYKLDQLLENFATPAG